MMRTGQSIISERIQKAYCSIVLRDRDRINTVSSINLTNWFNRQYRHGWVNVVDILWLIRQIQGGIVPPEFIRMNDAETSEVYRKLTMIIETAIADDSTDEDEDDDEDEDGEEEE